ncbi:MAG TPA: hypothetical protein VGZ05_09330 [Steroidobacteraceae bacterium]|jgi:hypothetical protein|nr:hypothetical protein [Steroidobacteraceae bacterium]
MWATTVVFAVAAGVGLTMAMAAFQGRFPPVASAVVHGVLAATGLLLLLYGVFMRGVMGAPRWALGFFVLAALGGSVLAFGFHARGRSLPRGYVLGHASVAVIGFLILLAAALHLL